MELEELKKEYMETLTEFRKTVATRDDLEKVGRGTGELNSKLATMELAFQSMEKKFEDQAAADQKRIANLEAKLARPGMGEARSQLDRKSFFSDFLFQQAIAPGAAEKKMAFDQALRTGLDYKTLTVENAETGGYLAAPPELADSIIKGAVELTPALQIATVKTTTRSVMRFPKRTAVPSMTMVGEGATKTETTGLTYGAEDITLGEGYCLIKVSQQNLEDTAFNLEAEIREVVDLAMSNAIGSQFITGSGVLGIEGITKNASVTHVASGHATQVKVSSLIDLSHGLKEGYLRNARWLLNRTTLAAIRGMTYGTGQLVWSPEFSQGVAGTILGYPYTMCPDVAEVGAGNDAMIFGDFKSACMIGIRLGLTIQRLVELYSASGEIGFAARTRFGGRVVLPEAIKMYRIEAS